MKNIQILTVTLLASALTLGAVTLPTAESKTQAKVKSISSTIASILHKRGLEEEASRSIAESFFQNNEELIAFMLENLKQGTTALSEDEILVYISTQALFRKNVELDSYSYLLSMTQQIRQRAPSKETMQELEKIAFQNSLFKGKVA